MLFLWEKLHVLETNCFQHTAKDLITTMCVGVSCGESFQEAMADVFNITTSSLEELQYLGIDVQEPFLIRAKERGWMSHDLSHR